MKRRISAVVRETLKHKKLPGSFASLRMTGVDSFTGSYAVGYPPTPAPWADLFNPNSEVESGTPMPTR
ncbi:hypothetical protein SBA2_70030 [Acidobacteriia bacterium SbA2]|nr:hypothetical protein SBA2_70030 [Acidobacteriia bacterium SbA2]